jgi:hypothetical protein
MNPSITHELELELELQPAIGEHARPQRGSFRCDDARRDPTRAAASIKLEQYREQWASRSPAVEVPVEPTERPEAHPLMGRLPDLATAQRVARRFDYDYSGLHLVPHRDHFRLFASGFEAVLGAGADAVSYDGARAWPGRRICLAPRGPCLSDRSLRHGAPRAKRREP